MRLLVVEGGGGGGGGGGNLISNCLSPKLNLTIGSLLSRAHDDIITIDIKLKLNLAIGSLLCSCCYVAIFRIQVLINQ